VETLKSGESPSNIVFVYWIIVVIYALFIFYLSHQPKIEQPGILADIPSIDKLEHFLEFLLFGLLLFLAFSNTPSEEIQLNAIILTVYVTFAYGIIDEFHQIFVPGRAPELVDALIDGLGGLIAGILAWRVLGTKTLKNDMQKVSSEEE
jgi:hypothetical protein